MSNRPSTTSAALIVAAASTILSLCAVDGPCFADTGGKSKIIEVKPEQLHALTFSKMVYKPVNKSEIGVLFDKFSIWILETLKEANYNVVGSESIVFDVDESNKARMVLGGTIEALSFHRSKTTTSIICDMAIRWEVLDRKKGVIIYEVVTRNSRIVTHAERYSAANIKGMIIGCLRSLFTREAFVSNLRLGAQERSTEDVPDRESGTVARCSGPDLSLPTDMERVVSSVVYVRQGGVSGTGFFISGDGLLLTAAHVVDGTEEVEVKTREGLVVAVKVVRFDPSGDVALLKFPGKTENCLDIADDVPDTGSELFAIGYPLSDDLSTSVSKGVTSGIREKDGLSYIQTDASLNPGNSGGPLLNESGEVVGISLFKVTGFDVEGLGFALGAWDALKRLSLSLGDKTKISPDERIATNLNSSERFVDEPDPEFGSVKERFEEIERARNIVFAPDRIARAGHGVFWINAPGFAVTMGITIAFLQNHPANDGPAPVLWSMNALFGLGTVAGITLWAVAHKLRKEKTAEGEKADLLLLPSFGHRTGTLSLAASF